MSLHHALALLTPLVAGSSPAGTSGEPHAAPHQRAGTLATIEVELPPGRVAELFAELRRRGAPPTAAPRGWPAWEDGSSDGWGGEAPWRDWVELLRSEAHAERADARRRARLALLCTTQGRSAEAWPHLVAAAEDDGGVLDASARAILPALFPGVPHEYLTPDASLPAGVLLTPGLPPPHDARLIAGRADALAGLAGRSLRIPELLIGETWLELRLVVEGDGVQVDFVHRSGPPVEVRLLLPVPGGVEIGRVYTNWEAIGEGRFPIALEVTPEPKRHTVWGRFRPRQDRWPAPSPSPGELPRAGADAAPLLVVVPPERLAEPRLARFAEALAELFGRRARLTTPANALQPGLFEPIAIHLEALADADSPGRVPLDSKLLGMIRTIEVHALAGAARR